MIGSELVVRADLAPQSLRLNEGEERSLHNGYHDGALSEI